MPRLGLIRTQSIIDRKQTAHCRVMLWVFELCGWTKLIIHEYDCMFACVWHALYTNRLIHRGTPNRTDDTKRPMLYLMYSKPWFREVKNFDDLNNEQLLEKRMEYASTKKATKKRKKDKKARQAQNMVEGSGVDGAATDKRDALGISGSSGDAGGEGKPTALAGLFG